MSSPTSARHIALTFLLFTLPSHLFICWLLCSETSPRPFPLPLACLRVDAWPETLVAL